MEEECRQFFLVGVEVELVVYVELPETLAVNTFDTSVDPWNATVQRIRSGTWVLTDEDDEGACGYAAQLGNVELQTALASAKAILRRYKFEGDVNAWEYATPPVTVEHLPDQLARLEDTLLRMRGELLGIPHFPVILDLEFEETPLMANVRVDVDLDDDDDDDLFAFERLNVQVNVTVRDVPQGVLFDDQHIRLMRMIQLFQFFAMERFCKTTMGDWDGTPTVFAGQTRVTREAYFKYDVDIETRDGEPATQTGSDLDGRVHGGADQFILQYRGLPDLRWKRWYDARFLRRLFGRFGRKVLDETELAIVIANSYFGFECRFTCHIWPLTDVALFMHWICDLYTFLLVHPRCKISEVLTHKDRNTHSLNAYQQLFVWLHAHRNRAAKAPSSLVGPYAAFVRSKISNVTASDLDRFMHYLGRRYVAGTFHIPPA